MYILFFTSLLNNKTKSIRYNCNKIIQKYALNENERINNKNGRIVWKNMEKRKGYIRIIKPQPGPRALISCLAISSKWQTKDTFVLLYTSR